MKTKKNRRKAWGIKQSYQVERVQRKQQTNLKTKSVNYIDYIANQSGKTSREYVQAKLN